MLFRKSVPFLCLMLSGCGPSWSDPVDGAPETPAPKPPAPLERIGGEYAADISYLSYICHGSDLTGSIGNRSTTISVVQQSDPRRFDLIGPGIGFGWFTVQNAYRESSDLFSARSDAAMRLFDRDGVMVTTEVAGTLSADKAAFTVHATAGWPTSDGFHVECEVRYVVTGTPRYKTWSGETRTTIDGQWEVRRTVASDVIEVAVPEHRVVIDSAIQRSDDSTFDLRGPLLYFADVPRTSDGVVDYYTIRPNQELFLTGRIVKDALDLVVIKKNYDDSNRLLNTVEEHYTGTPRFAPLVPENPGGHGGAYRGRFLEFANTCTNNPTAHQHVFDARIDRDGFLKLKFLNQETGSMAVGEDGSFSLMFDSTDFEVDHTVYYLYGRFGAGGGLDMTIHLKVGADTNNGVPVCEVLTFVKSAKRYADYEAGR